MWSVSRSSVEQAGHLCGVRATQVWNKRLICGMKIARKCLSLLPRKRLTKRQNTKQSLQTEDNISLQKASVCTPQQATVGGLIAPQKKPQPTKDIPTPYQGRTNAVPRPFQHRSLRSEHDMPQNHFWRGSDSKKYLFYEFSGRFSSILY